MLQSIRDRATGPIAWGIVGLITIPFAFWGIDSYVSGPSNPEVAEVGGVEITQGQLQRAYDQQYQRLQQLMGENFDPDSINNAQLRRGVLENLVREQVLTQHVSDAGYRVSDVAIANTLREQQAFHEGGSFSLERYREVLARNGFTPSAYEARLRNALAVEQLQTGVSASAFVTRADVDAAARLEKQRRRVQYLEFDVARYARQVELSETSVRDYYEAQPARFSTPERVRLAYLELDKSNLEPAGEPDEVVLRAMYEAEKNSRFTSAEQRKARHILIQFGDDEAAAQAKIEALAAELKAGADFEALAREHSEDAGSRDEGGDLGWVGRGVMVPEFEKVLFQLEEGETSEPVRTPFGWHLIRVEEVQPQQVRPFENEEVQKVLLRLYREKELAERFQQMSKRLDDLSFDNPDSLEPAADALDLQIKTSDWIDRQGGKNSQGLGQHSAVVEAAFSPAVLEDGENSSPIKLGENRYVVVRVAKHEEARRRPLEEVRDDIEDQLRRQQGQARAQAQAEEAVKRLRDGQSAAAVANAMGLQLEVPGWIQRDNEKLDTRLVNTVFGMPHPRGDRPAVEHTGLANGNQAVVLLSAVEDGEPGQLSSEERQEIKRRLVARTANREFRVYESSVRSDMDVSIHEAALEQ